MNYGKVLSCSLGLAVVLSACAMPRTLVLSTPAVSMTHTSFDSGTKFTAGKEIKSRYCVGDDAISSSKDDSNIGFMDELVTRAQKDSGAKYIANAQFFTQGTCMELEGVAMN